MVSSPEIVDSVNALILADIKELGHSEKVEIHVGIKLCMMTLPFIKSGVIGFH